MAVVNGYCTTQELRDHFGDPGTKLDANLLERAINAASRAIDKFCGRRFWQDAQAQTKVYRCTDPYWAEVDDVSTTSGLIVATGDDGTYDTTWASTDYQLEPLNADAEETGHAWWTIAAIDRYTFPVHERRTTLSVTARFGWSAVPDDVEEACILKAASLFKRKEAPFGVASVGDFAAVRIGRNDPDVTSLLHNFIKIKVGSV